MTTLTIIWSYLKKYWGIAALIIGTVFAVLFLRNRTETFADQLKKIQDAHDAEIKQIQAARDEEQRQRLADEKRLQDALSAVQQQYDAANKDLDAKKKAEIAVLVKQYGNDPTALAQKLSEVTGFVIVMPS